MTEEDRIRESAANNVYGVDVRLYLRGATSGVTYGRVCGLNSVLDALNPEQLDRLRVEECCDEKTGRRYGTAACRKGRAEKIGGGGRNKGSRYAYQVWAVWA